jgi:hypothetical protein
VLTPAQIAQLPPHKVIAYTSSMPPVIGRADRAWKRADVRAALQPGSIRVRARAAAVGLAGLVAGWLMWPGRTVAGVTARGYRWVAAAVRPWVARRRAAWARRVSELRSAVGWGGTVAPEPHVDVDDATVSRPTGAEVIPFRRVPRPEPEAGTESAAMPIVEWPRDDDELGRGRWN